MKRALIAALLLAGCGSGEKPLKMGDPVLIDSGGKDVLVWTEIPVKGRDRNPSILIACGSRATFLDGSEADGLARVRLDGGPVAWTSLLFVVPDPGKR